jgi:hypothetical protein
MEYTKAEVVIHQPSGEQTQASLIPFQFTPGDQQTYTGADGTGGIALGAGWLGLMMAEFPGWHSASIIELSYAGGHSGDHVFHVSKNMSRPKKDGEWLWFPVMVHGDVAPFKS